MNLKLVETFDFDPDSLRSPTRRACLCRGLGTGNSKLASRRGRPGRYWR